MKKTLDFIEQMFYTRCIKREFDSIKNENTHNGDGIPSRASRTAEAVISSAAPGDLEAGGTPERRGLGIIPCRRGSRAQHGAGMVRRPWARALPPGGRIGGFPAFPSPRSLDGSRLQAALPLPGAGPPTAGGGFLRVYPTGGDSIYGLGSLPSGLHPRDRRGPVCGRLCGHRGLDPASPPQKTPSSLCGAPGLQGSGTKIGRLRPLPAGHGRTTAFFLAQKVSKMRFFGFPDPQPHRRKEIPYELQQTAV